MPAGTRFCGVCGHARRTRATAPAHPTAGHTMPPSTGSASSAQTVAHSPASTDVRFAGAGIRCAAFLLDVAAMLSPALPLSIAGAVLGVSEVVYLVVPVAFVAVWLWMQIWQGLTGNSFGKAMLGLRLVRSDDHTPPGVMATLQRSLIAVLTLGLAALPLVLQPTSPAGWHDRACGLTVLDVTLGANPLGPRQQNTLRRNPYRGINRVHSPIPVAAPRQG